MDAHEGLRDVGSVVGHSDRTCQAENVGLSDKPAAQRLKLYLVSDSSRAIGGVGNPKKSRRRKPVCLAEAFPELQQGKFVGIFHELTNQWAARRDATAQQPVKGNLEIVRDRDGGFYSGAVASALYAGNRRA